jgi:hypothetical protein
MWVMIHPGGHTAHKSQHLVLLFVFILVLVSLACAISRPTPTNPPEPTSTETAIPTATQTPRPSPTPRPTRTPNLAATQHAEELIGEVQSYYEKGYLNTTSGKLTELDDFSHDWAYLGGYQPLVFVILASDFFLSAHFKWDSAFQNSNTSGCGFIFAMQPNDDHYVVFLDRTKVEFRISTHGFSTRVKPIRGTGQVKFDYPAEADFTLIVKGAYAYVLVNGEVVSEYALLQNRPLRGDLGLTVVSGTNKDYGTRCEMTNLRLWLPED